MDFHVITPRGAELLMRTVDDKLIIVPPPPPPPSSQQRQALPALVGAQIPPALGK